MARPKVKELATALECAGLLQADVMMQHFDSVTEHTVRRLEEGLDDEERRQVRPIPRVAVEQAAAEWESVRTG
eukprot:7409949-Karenia_brevis.AAC.1